MKRKMLSIILAAAMFCTSSALTVSAAEPAAHTVSAAALARASVDEAYVYEAITALKDKYPDGMDWTNDQFYIWNGGGSYIGGFGCVAFAFILSDAAFGNLPSRQCDTLDLSAIRVGDIIRYSEHSVIVLEVHEDHVVVAEGNIAGIVMWGRRVSIGELSGGFDHYLTRYPKDAEAAAAALGDVNEDGDVDAADAANILVAAAAVGAGKDSGFTEQQKKAADVNGSGGFDSQDAANILQYAAAAGSGFKGSLEEFMKTLG